MIVSWLINRHERGTLYRQLLTILGLVIATATKLGTYIEMHVSQPYMWHTRCDDYVGVTFECFF